MILVERHFYKSQDNEYAELDGLCFLSKNLYNATLYAVRQHFFKTGEYLNYNSVNAQFTHESQQDYSALPRKVSKLVQQLVDKSFKSFFALLAKKNKGELTADTVVRPPKYLDPQKGRQVVEYTKQALSFVESGFIRLSGTTIKVPTEKKDIKFARIVPKPNNVIVVELGYEQEVAFRETGGVAAIDLGVNNLAAVTSDSFAPFILNGKPLKAINQYYNKRLAQLRAKQDLSGSKRKTTNRIAALTRKRNAKVSDYLHKSSRELANHLALQNIAVLVIGYNKGWKQDVNLGKATNQKFVQIPFLQFVDMLIYKCALLGIRVEMVTEEYTSKCSFLDDECIGKHEHYQGRRVKRGLFKTATGVLINADVNASFNILKKYLHEKVAWNLKLFKNCVEVCSAPSVFTVNC